MNQPQPRNRRQLQYQCEQREWQVVRSKKENIKPNSDDLEDAAPPPKTAPIRKRQKAVVRTITPEKQHRHGKRCQQKKCKKQQQKQKKKKKKGDSSSDKEKKRQHRHRKKRNKDIKAPPPTSLQTIDESILIVSDEDDDETSSSDDSDSDYYYYHPPKHVFKIHFQPTPSRQSKNWFDFGGPRRGVGFERRAIYVSNQKNESVLSWNAAAAGASDSIIYLSSDSENDTTIGSNEGPGGIATCKQKSSVIPADPIYPAAAADPKSIFPPLRLDDDDKTTTRSNKEQSQQQQKQQWPFNRFKRGMSLSRRISFRKSSIQKIRANQLMREIAVFEMFQKRFHRPNIFDHMRLVMKRTDKRAPLHLLQNVRLTKVALESLRIRLKLMAENQKHSSTPTLFDSRGFPKKWIVDDFNRPEMAATKTNNNSIISQQQKQRPSLYKRMYPDLNHARAARKRNEYRIICTTREK